MRLGSGLDLLDMGYESANASLPATPMLPTAAMPSQTRHIVSKLRTSFDACWLLREFAATGKILRPKVE